MNGRLTLDQQSCGGVQLSRIRRLTLAGAACNGLVCACVVSHCPITEKGASPHSRMKLRASAHLAPSKPDLAERCLLCDLLKGPKELQAGEADGDTVYIQSWKLSVWGIAGVPEAFTGPPAPSEVS